MSTTSLEVQLKLLGKEEFSDVEAPAANNAQQRMLFTGRQGVRKEFGPATLPKVDAPIVAREITLAGALTLDLTAILSLALPGAATRTLDQTGKKLKWFFFRAAIGNNAAGITIAPGAANPYPIFGAAKPIIVTRGRIEAGGFDSIESDLPTVAAGVKNIDLTPGAAGDILYVEFHFGAP
jgi:hypothetical protein